MGMGARLPTLAAALLLTACTGVQPTSTLGQPTQATAHTPGQPTPTSGHSTPSPIAISPRPPTPSPLVTPESGINLELISDGPVLEPSALDGDVYTFTLPAAYFIADGTHHLYVVGFTDIPGNQRVFHATSEGGFEWTVDPEDPFANLGLDTSPPGPVPGSVIRAENGEWLMYLWAVRSPLFEGAEIYRATAPGPGGPWTSDPDPVVPRGQPGEVDDRALDFPAVVATDGGYVMLYGANGGDSPLQARILLARSDDGIVWQKAGRVLEPQLCGGTAADFTAIPRLALVDGTYFLLVVIGDDIAALTSPNAVEWTCVRDGPLFTAAEIPGNQRVHTIAAAHGASGVSVLVEALVGGGSELWLAELTGL